MPEPGHLISCIIPTFNRASKVTEAIKSVLTQTYQQVEVLVIDDQSADNTKEAVGKIADADYRVKYYYNPVKGGNHARNFGINKASGDYIAFLDDDDVWEPEKLEKQLQCFAKSLSRTGVVYCTFERKSQNGKTRRHPSRWSREKEGDMLKYLLRRNFITTSSLLVKSEVFKICGGFSPEFKSFQDWELLIRMAEKYRFGFVREILVKQYESNDSITLNKRGRLLAKLRLVRQYKHLYTDYPRILSYRYRSLGFDFVKQKQFRRAKRFYQASLRYRSFNPAALLMLALIGMIRGFQSRS
jgi:glycosyltransferase involved in cell wall biosynthesis